MDIHTTLIVLLTLNFAVSATAVFRLSRVISRL